jgi:hypothetical protein
MPMDSAKTAYGAEHVHALRYHFCDKFIWLFAKAELVVNLVSPAARSLVDGNQN